MHVETVFRRVFMPPLARPEWQALRGMFSGCLSIWYYMNEHDILKKN